MKIKIKKEINGDKLIERILNHIFGTVSKLLVFAGLGFLSFGFFDMLIYVAELKFAPSKAQHPGDFGWQQMAGFLFIFSGLGIKVWEYFYTKRNEKLEEECEFFDNFMALSQAEFRAKTKRLFGLINPDIDVAKKVLSHPTNQGSAFDTYRVCHLHIKDDKPWLLFSSSYFKERYTFGLVFNVILLPFFILSILFMLGLELYYPGITNSGENAYEAYIGLAFITILAALSMFHDFKKMGHAITLVEGLKPDKNL